MGRQPQRRVPTCYLARFSWKLHEDEENQSKVEGTPPKFVFFLIRHWELVQPTSGPTSPLSALGGVGVCMKILRFEFWAPHPLTCSCSAPLLLSSSSPLPFKPHGARITPDYSTWFLITAKATDKHSVILRGISVLTELWSNPLCTFLYSQTAMDVSHTRILNRNLQENKYKIYKIYPQSKVSFTKNATLMNWLNYFLVWRSWLFEKSSIHVSHDFIQDFQ